MNDIVETIAKASLLVRAAAVAQDRGSAPPSVTATPIVHTGAGVWTWTIANGIASAQCAKQATISGATAGSIIVEDNSATIKVIRTFNAAGAAADLDFDVIIAQIP
jgi:hypothetical protein